MATMSIRDVRLWVEVIGHGPPLLLMHGGPGADHWTLRPFRHLADQFRLVFYDHRCNGRSTGAQVETMTFENLSADADALREALGFERWAVLGHSFGGHVALEYALRYPDRLSHLVLLDTGADSHWSRENAPEVVRARGYGGDKADLVRRWFHGEIEPGDMFRILMRLGPIYDPHMSPFGLLREVMLEGRHTKLRPDAFIYAGRTLLKGWTVVQRLSDIEMPTLVMAGREDFIFPPECQEVLARGIPDAQLRLIEGAGHNPHEERATVVMDAVREFLRSGAAARGALEGARA
jgi:proline iminopeptidase